MLYQVCVSWSHFQCLAFISFLFALQQHQSSSSVLDCRVEPSQTERNQSSTPPRVHRFISLSTSRVESSRTEGREGGALQGWWRTIDDPKGEQRGKTGGVGSSHNPPQWKAFLFFLYHFPILIFCFSFRIVRETSMVVWFHITFTALLLLLLLAVGIGIACTLSRPFKFSVHFYFYS